jgi:hypothetical protein
MTSIAWDLANDRGGDGGLWNLADPVAALGWLDRMHEMALALKTSDRKAGAKMLDREALARAGVLQELGRDAESGALYKESLRLSRDEAAQTLSEAEHQLVCRYLYADHLLTIHDARGAAVTAPPVPPPIVPRENNRAERSQRADILGQHARIDLASGRVAIGKREMTESLAVFEELYRSDPKDTTSMEELASSVFDLAGEANLDSVERHRLYDRFIELTAPFERAHPEVLGATMRIAKANLGLARLEGQPATRRAYLEAAEAGLKKVLAAHPNQPEAERLIVKVK